MAATEFASATFIMEGDFDIYVADTDASLPTDIDTSTDGSLTFDADWTKVAFKDGGVKINYAKTMNDEYVDDAEEPIKHFVERAGGTIEFNIKQAHATAFALAMDAVVSGDAGTTKQTIKVGGAKPTYKQIFLHARTEEAGYFAFHIHRASAEGSFESQFMKGRAMVVPFKMKMFGDMTKPRGERLFAIYYREPSGD